ncbi:MAG: hypothetical protein JXR31_02485 [Prolixibacteraceae bacterium]|nr:hypothetical protein [Prolixibacteraceae bacterium]
MISDYLIKALRKIIFTFRKPAGFSPFEGYVQYRDEEANDLIKSRLFSEPTMVCKFGTVELGCMSNFKSIKVGKSFRNMYKYVVGEKQSLWWWNTIDTMANNAGLFPATEKMAERFCKLMLDDIKEIDILGSYIKDEIDFHEELAHTLKINIEGYYAPFLFEHPWTELLEGKKVLVIHPFDESIKNQYLKRKLLFNNPKVLPDFELITIKAVQSIANTKTQFNDWFEALESMKEQISDTDFDIALIGCGAYGLPLAAHVKRMGKSAVHLAGWTQMLFGIYGHRWENDKRFSSFINEHWIKPSENEKPENFKKVENGCYW